MIIVLPLLNLISMKLRLIHYKIRFLDCFFLIILLGALLLCCPYLIDSFRDKKLNSDAIDHIGSFIGGIATLISIYYLYKTLRSQEKGQDVQFFESRFIEMVKFNRDILDKALIAFKSERPNAVGLFESFLEQIEHMSVIVDEFMPADVKDIYMDSSLDVYNMDKSLYGENLKKRTSLNIQYLIVLVGVSSDSQIHLLQNVYLKHYNTLIVRNISNKVRLYAGRLFETLPENLNALELDQLRSNPDKYFWGYQKYICNYLRTMFQAISYVEKKDFLKDNEKYEYVKILRGQLSNEEEQVLFYNSLSILGQDWEYSSEGSKRKLITKYNMIKNIPDDEKGYLKSFYPDINYEYQF